jgi:hypothetical protein
MTRVSRRGAIKALGAAAAAPIVQLDVAVATGDSRGFHLPPSGEAGRRTRRSPGEGGQADAIDAATLTAIADVVLPSESDRKAAVAGFVRWIREYREGADTDHGYGNTRLRQTGPSPARAYAAHLSALDSAARARGARSFAAAPLDDRRAIVEAALAEAKIERLPGRPNGGHVATDLMGHYFASEAAANLCYRAQIDRDTCRGLPGSERAPAPLAPRAPRAPR